MEVIKVVATAINTPAKANKNAANRFFQNAMLTIITAIVKTNAAKHNAICAMNLFSAAISKNQAATSKVNNANIRESPAFYNDCPAKVINFLKEPNHLRNNTEKTKRSF